MTKVSFGTLDITPTDRFHTPAGQIDRAANRNLSLADRWSLTRGRKGNAVRQRSKRCQFRSCPRNCDREVLSGCATDGRLPPGRQGKATIREPGDLPSAVSTRQTSVGVYRWMIQKTYSLLVLARAGDRRQVRR